MTAPPDEITEEDAIFPAAVYYADGTAEIVQGLRSRQAALDWVADRLIVGDQDQSDHNSNRAGSS